MGTKAYVATWRHEKEDTLSREWGERLTKTARVHEANCGGVGNARAKRASSNTKADLMLLFSGLVKKLHVYIYVYIYTYTYICVHIRMYIHLHPHSYTSM
jgi:hypothetical protein